MSTLLIRLAGPMQSWGSRSRFATRGTESAPTKSGVIGLVAAALGIRRNEPLERFAGTRFGVRIDQPGRLERDFQTARSLDGAASMPLSHRYYLADAVFLAGLEHEDRGRLEAFAEALKRPAFPLYLGRRAFPPAGPIDVTVTDVGLDRALGSAPWTVSETYRDANGRAVPELELLLETAPDNRHAEPIRDEPRSFDPRRREYGWRSVETLWIANPSADWPRQLEHDPLELLPKAE